MKNRMLLVVVLIVAVFGVSCKRDSKLPDPNAKVSEYATIAPTKVMFLALSKAGLDGDLAQAKIESWTPVKDDVDNAAYSWGVMLANAQLHILNNQPNQLKYTIDKLIMLAPVLKLDAVGDKLSSDVLPKATKKDWQWLQTAIYSMQSEVDRLLSERNDSKQYTLIKLGEWTSTTKSLAALAANDSANNYTPVLAQTDAWTSISKNLLLLSKEDKKADARITQSLTAVKKILGICSAVASTPLTGEQLTQLTSITAGITELYSLKK